MNPDDLAAHVQRNLAQAPPLTPERANRLAVLLRPKSNEQEEAKAA